MSRWHQPTWEAAAGKWRGVLMELGVPGEALTGKHGPCPMCGGRDRFRFDNKEGSGSYICSACGAGTGMQFAERFTRQTFREVAGRIDAILGNVKPDADPPPRTMGDEDRRALLRRTWAATQPVKAGDLVDAYLRSRGLDAGDEWPGDLRFAPRLNDGEGGVRPCMVAMVRDVEGRPATLHRTFLRPDGLAKAEMPVARKLMPGELPPGAAVRLFGFCGGPLGIAEGIETALAAAALYEIPVWAAISATVMAKWEPPQGCDELVVFADNDPKFAGQAAGYRLAHRVATRAEAEVCVRTPPNVGQDWADVWLERCGGRCRDRIKGAD